MAAAAECGSGSFQRMKDLLYRHVANKKTEIFKQGSQSIIVGLNDLVRSIIDQVNGVHTLLCGDMDLHFSTFWAAPVSNPHLKKLKASLIPEIKECYKEVLEIANQLIYEHEPENPRFFEDNLCTGARLPFKYHEDQARREGLLDANLDEGIPSAGLDEGLPDANADANLDANPSANPGANPGEGSPLDANSNINPGEGSPDAKSGESLPDTKVKLDGDSLGTKSEIKPKQENIKQEFTSAFCTEKPVPGATSSLSYPNNLKVKLEHMSTSAPTLTPPTTPPKTQAQTAPTTPPPATTTATTPATTPAMTPAMTPATTPVKTPVKTPATTPITTSDTMPPVTPPTLPPPLGQVKAVQSKFSLLSANSTELAPPSAPATPNPYTYVRQQEPTVSTQDQQAQSKPEPEQEKQEQVQEQVQEQEQVQVQEQVQEKEQEHGQGQGQQPYNATVVNSGGMDVVHRTWRF
eukprot:TRINITY_DN2732_c4_g1_i1.p1 TRINITY_DN2732_c4_g1~~TRINITY_DN2732_c4_g1_i1.p1  ORF type:complete len:478 (+),score=100.21 TRINITY_DN2732_c4_g1_i1:43-1434(+)